MVAPLPQFPGQTSAMPMDINNVGDIVGQAQEGWNTYRPFLIRDGVLYNLNLFPRRGPEIQPSFPMKINDRGQILGVTFRGGETIGFTNADRPGAKARAPGKCAEFRFKGCRLPASSRMTR